MTKTILVVGAGPGNGLATARKFAANGFRAVLASSGGAADALAAELRGEGLDAVGATVDAGDVNELTRLVAGIGQDLEVLHYNVGVIRMAGIDDQDAASIASDIQLDITGAVVALKAALPGMTARGSGTVLYTGGGLALQPYPQFLTLSLGKVGIRTLAQMMFEPMAARGIHVATLTIAASIAPRSKEAAGVADAFWGLYSQPRTDWTWEATYKA